MNRRNYQRELEQIIAANEGEKPTLLLHSCCAPCSSYVFEYLAQHFAITDFYYNPNITEESEYRKRVDEIKRLIRELPEARNIGFVEGRYDPQAFFHAAEGYEDCPEGGERCARCFHLRLRESARYAREHSFDFLTTTLTISPLKNAEVLNRIGKEETERANREIRPGGGEDRPLTWLPSDFKKKGGYQRSIVLSTVYHLYRQNYCGCVFSKRRDYGKLTDKT